MNKKNKDDTSIEDLIIKISNMLENKRSNLLRPQGLSSQMYDFLRVVSFAERQGISRSHKDIAILLGNKIPAVSRIAKRAVEEKLITITRHQLNHTEITITKQGQSVLESSNRRLSSIETEIVNILKSNSFQFCNELKKICNYFESFAFTSE